MSSRWIFLALACFLVIDCGSSSDADDSGGDGSNGCQDGYISKGVCLQCGPAGGCGKQETKCARVCSTPDHCKDLQLFCSDGVCQVAGCI